MDACKTHGDGEEVDPHSELLALRGKLARLVTDDLEAVIAFEMPEATGSTKAAVAHRRTTAHYKSQQLIALAPDSQAIAQACAYLVLRSLNSKSKVAPGLFERLADILTGAGYQRDQIEATVRRLLDDLDRRQTRWQRSQVRKLSSALAEAIRRSK